MNLALEAWLEQRSSRLGGRHWRGHIRWAIARNLRSDSGQGKGNKAWRRLDRMQRKEQHCTITQADLFGGIL